MIRKVFVIFALSGNVELRFRIKSNSLILLYAAVA